MCVLSGGTATFGTKNVGTNKTVALSGRLWLVGMRTTTA